MEKDDLIHKTVFSLEGKRLGRVFRVEGSTDAEVLDEKAHLIVKVERLITPPDLIEIPTERITKVEKRAVFLDITRDDFKQMQREFRAERKYKEKAARAKNAAKKEYDRQITRMMSRRR